MSKTAIASLSVNVQGDGVSLTQSFANTNAAAAAPDAQTLAVGNNTITVPTGVTVQGVTIVPPTQSAVSKTLKGVAGDTGIALATSVPTSLALAASVTSFVVTASSGEVVQLVWW